MEREERQLERKEIEGIKNKGFGLFDIKRNSLVNLDPWIYWDVGLRFDLGFDYLNRWMSLTYEILKLDWIRFGMAKIEIKLVRIELKGWL